jgi:SMI1/KNR4 family protein SUKH-1
MSSAPFKNRGRSPSRESLTSLEVVLNATLPSSYRSFLTDANGGRLLDWSYFELAGRRLGVREIFAIDDAACSFTQLERAMQTYRDRVPAHFVPIADDHAGNLWCLHLSGTAAGSIWFWEHEFEADDGVEPTLDNMVLVAGDFASFLNGIQVADLT